MYYLYTVGPCGLKYVQEAPSINQLKELVGRVDEESVVEPPHPGMKMVENYIWVNYTPFSYYPRSARNSDLFFVITKHPMRNPVELEPRFMLDLDPRTNELNDQEGLMDVFHDCSGLVNDYNYLKSSLSVTIADNEGLEQFYLNSPLFGNELGNIGYFDPENRSIKREKLIIKYPGFSVAFGEAEFSLLKLHGNKHTHFEVVSIDGDQYLTSLDEGYLPTLICCIDEDGLCWLPNQRQHWNLMSMNKFYDYRIHSLCRELKVVPAPWINRDYQLMLLMEMLTVKSENLHPDFESNLRQLVNQSDFGPESIFNIREFMGLSAKMDKAVSDIMHEL